MWINEEIIQIYISKCTHSCVEDTGMHTVIGTYTVSGMYTVICMCTVKGMYTVKGMFTFELYQL